MNDIQNSAISMNELLYHNLMNKTVQNSRVQATKATSEQIDDSESKNIKNITS